MIQNTVESALEKTIPGKLSTKKIQIRFDAKSKLIQKATDINTQNKRNDQI